MSRARSEDRTGAVTEFLNHEAELLDDGHLSEWLDLIHEDITYEVPIRVSRENESTRPTFSQDSFHLNETIDSLRARVSRFETEYAWAENPRSRTRRFVSNVRVTGDDDGEVTVKNNLLLYRHRGEPPETDIITGERHDTLLDTADGLKLTARRVLLDNTLMETRDLSIFL